MNSVQRKNSIMPEDELSTFDRKMQNLEFRKAFEKGYEEFLLSELMKKNYKTAQDLA